MMGFEGERQELIKTEDWSVLKNKTSAHYVAYRSAEAEGWAREVEGAGEREALNETRSGMTRRVIGGELLKAPA